MNKKYFSFFFLFFFLCGSLLNGSAGPGEPIKGLVKPNFHPISPAPVSSPFQQHLFLTVDVDKGALHKWIAIVEPAERILTESLNALFKEPIKRGSEEELQTFLTRYNETLKAFSKALRLAFKENRGLFQGKSLEGKTTSLKKPLENWRILASLDTLFDHIVLIDKSFFVPSPVYMENNGRFSTSPDNLSGSRSNSPYYQDFADKNKTPISVASFKLNGFHYDPLNLIKFLRTHFSRYAAIKKPTKLPFDSYLVQFQKKLLLNEIEPAKALTQKFICLPKGYNCFNFDKTFFATKIGTFSTLFFLLFNFIDTLLSEKFITALEPFLNKHVAEKNYETTALATFNAPFNSPILFKIRWKINTKKRNILISSLYPPK